MFSIDEFKKENKSIKEQFIDKLCDIPDEISVSDFVWTKEVEEQFEKHPFHKGFVKFHKNGRSQVMASYGWFILNSYPRTI